MNKKEFDIEQDYYSATCAAIQLTATIAGRLPEHRSEIIRTYIEWLAAYAQQSELTDEQILKFGMGAVEATMHCIPREFMEEFSKVINQIDEIQEGNRRTSQGSNGSDGFKKK